MKKKIIAVIGVLAGLLVVGGCGYNIPANMVAVHVQSGSFSTKKVVGCETAGTRKVWTNDQYPLFPTSEREWDATGQKGADAGPFQSTTKDSVVMVMPITIRFTLDTSCPKLKKFYLAFAQRYGVQFQTDGSYNNAWEQLLRKLVADPADQTLDRIVHDYNWKDVWKDPGTKTLIEQRMNNNIQQFLRQTAHDNYFESVSVLLGSPTPQDKTLAAAVASAQARVAQAQAEQAQADADRSTALAQVKVAQAQAEKQAATIKGYGGIDAYLKYQCIQQGCNPYQPTYLVGTNSTAK